MASDTCLDPAILNRQTAGIAVVAGKRRCACAFLDHTTLAVTGDVAVKLRIIAPVEGQRAVTIGVARNRDITHNAARRATVADLQDTAGHRRTAAITVRTRQNQCAVVGLAETPCSLQFSFNRRRDIRIRLAVANANDRRSARRTIVEHQRIARQNIAVGRKLQTRRRHHSVLIIDCDRTGITAEHGK